MRPPEIDFARRGPLLAYAAAILLLLGGLLGAIFGEADYRGQRLEQAEAHATILAESVSAALAFQDLQAAREATLPLRQRADIIGIGVYDASGRLVHGWAREGYEVPEEVDPRPRRGGTSAAPGAVAAVDQGGAQLGWVSVTLSPGGGVARFARTATVILLLAMAALLTLVLTVSQRSLSRANLELSRRADALEKANADLSAEIAERKRTQDALAQAQKMEAIGQLTGGVAHDFNNLLMVISSGLRLLETRSDPQARASIVSAMNQAVERGASLTKQLLAFARRQKLTPEVVRLGDRLLSMRPLLERSLREDIILDIDIIDRDAAAMIDAGQFDIALLNLAVNARDAMPNGGRLRIAVKHEGDAELVVSVTDNGVGMSQDVRERAVDPFFTTKPVGQGTGLGLSQVYGFAAQSGGRCEIESAPGLGTTISLVLPRRDAPPIKASGAAQPMTTGSGLVLVVEDEDSVAAMVCAMLEDLGYGTRRVANAREALDLIYQDGGFDLIFSDVIMPDGMNGVELARELRRRRPDLPIVLTTGYAGKADIDAEGFSVLHKPYQKEDLARTVAEQIADRRRLA